MTSPRSRRRKSQDSTSPREESAGSTHSIGYLCRRTGLTSHVIRVWERRYQAIRPGRSDRGRRLYTEADLQRLERLAEATRRGHRIGDIAALDDRELERLAGGPAPVEDPGAPAGDRMARLIESFDGEAMGRELDDQRRLQGVTGFVHEVLVPLFRGLGEGWSRGEITTAHEHFTTHAVRDALGRIPPAPSAPDAPLIVLATPPGQHHEMGVRMAAAVAGELGWKVCYLGPCVPLVEVACAVRSTRARAVALGLTYPADDPGMIEEMEQLMARIPPGVRCFVGGAAVPAYVAGLVARGLTPCADMLQLREHLLEIQRNSQPLDTGGGTR